MTTNGVESYREKYTRVVFEREDEILLVRLHTDGGPMRHGVSSHHEMAMLFRDLADDRTNRVVILTGTGDEFIGPKAQPFGGPDQIGQISVRGIDEFRAGAIDMLHSLLRIDVPVICAVNGPTVRHAEIPAMCDIVLASETATFQDSAHFINGMPPGDGQHVIMPLAIGINRARYYLLTGQTITADEALQYGLVNEILPAGRLLDRAWELARQLGKQSMMNLRMSRRIVTKPIRKAMEDYMEYGIAHENLGIVDHGQD